jgi:hypothetical protein
LIRRRFAPAVMGSAGFGLHFPHKAPTREQSYAKETVMSSAEDYQAKAAEALVQLAEAKTESERSRLKRAHGAYLRLSTHGAEAAERAAAKPAKKIVPEKAPAAAPRPSFRLS